MTRAQIAARANAEAKLCRYGGAPTLSADSPRESVVAWLQWNDPNGSHDDYLAEKDGCDLYDIDRAWDTLSAMLTD
jgi:hypothetical protein